MDQMQAPPQAGDARSQLLAMAAQVAGRHSGQVVAPERPPQVAPAELEPTMPALTVPTSTTPAVTTPEISHVEAPSFPAPEVVEPEPDRRGRRRGDKSKDSKPKDRKKPKKASSEREPARTGTWTTGNALVSKAVTVLLTVALLTGPAALGLSMLSQAAPAPAAASTQPIAWNASSVAGERARELVSAWLTATRDDDDRFLALFPGAKGQLPTTASEVRDVTVAEVSEQGSGLWAVTVGADVRTPAEQSDAADVEADEPGEWVRRFFLVPVAVGVTDAGLGAQILALPAPVAGPVQAEGVALAYPATQSVSGPMGQAVTDFLAALVTGQGDVTRYVSPGTQIRAVAPAAYEAVTLTGLSSTSTGVDVEAPGDGAELSVLATVTLTGLDGRQTAAQYALELRARAGRWEVAEMGQAPQVEKKSGETSGDEAGATPAPSMTNGEQG